MYALFALHILKKSLDTMEIEYCPHPPPPPLDPIAVSSVFGFRMHPTLHSNQKEQERNGTSLIEISSRSKQVYLKNLL